MGEWRVRIIENPYRSKKTMQVKDLTVEELKQLIQETVTETLEAMLSDPDAGQELQPAVKQALVDSLQRTQAGDRGIAADEVAKKLGLDW
jgi:hypothetical protein